MRRKQEAVLCFECNDDGLPKVVRDYRDRYRAIGQVLDDNPKILSLVHADLLKLSEGDSQGREGDYTSENILRALVVQHLEGLPFRDTVIRIGGDLFLQEFARMRKRPVMGYSFLDKCFLAIEPKTGKRVNELLGHYGVAQKMVSTNVIRTDTTVVEANIHYPTDASYRIVVVWKELDVYRGQKKLFDDARCFFYITNDWQKLAEQIVFEANGRCNQKNLLAQLKGDVRSLTAPVDNLLSAWACMVMGSLAWSLKAWAALMLPEAGRWLESQREEKHKLLRMDFTTFRHALMTVPAQILSTGRRIVCRLLAWNSWQHVFFRLLDQLRQPLRC